MDDESDAMGLDSTGSDESDGASTAPWASGFQFKPLPEPAPQPSGSSDWIREERRFRQAESDQALARRLDPAGWGKRPIRDFLDLPKDWRPG